MKKLHVAKSPITNRIYCGGVLKDGVTWAANKEDVTGQACAAVAQHAMAGDWNTAEQTNGDCCPNGDGQAAADSRRAEWEREMRADAFGER